MTTIDIDTITQAAREALSHRDSRRDALAQRIRQMTQDVLEATRRHKLDLPDPDRDPARTGGTIEYRTPVADCSQWSNHVDYPNHRGEPCLMFSAFGERGWRSLGPVPEVGFWDGSNLQHQQGPTREWETGIRIRPATVAQLKAVARVLPGVLAELLAETCDCARREAIEADETIETL